MSLAVYFLVLLPFLRVQLVKKTRTTKPRKCCLLIVILRKSSVVEFSFVAVIVRRTRASLALPTGFLGRCQNSRWALCGHLGASRATTVVELSKFVAKKACRLEEGRRVNKRTGHPR